MRIISIFQAVCAGLLPILGLAYVMSLPQRLGFSVVGEEYLAVLLGLATATCFLRYPYAKVPEWVSVLLAAAALAAWCFAAINYQDWILDAHNRTVAKWLPGAIAIVLLLEGVRKACGLSIAILFWGFLFYGLVGDYLPGVLRAFSNDPDKLIIYLYADSNGVLGLVLGVVCTVVLAFIIFGKLLDMTGGGKFFTDLAMALMGRRRGGPAKVAVVASAAFGSINGTTVGNIISTGIVTIPLMKRYGFKSHHAAAFEAVASNGGQIAPPIMGATAFLIAEFLQIEYSTVVLAALIPAFLYYLALFLQIDAIAIRYKLTGLKKEELPVTRKVLARGWIFLIPLGVLIYVLLGLGYEPGISAIYAIIMLLICALVLFRTLPSPTVLGRALTDSGEALLPLIMIGGGAGIVIGVLNITGLGFQLAISLTGIAETAGLLVMLIVAALICIVIGVGMPTAAVYVIVSVVLAPAVIKMGVEPLGAHLFLFYFGLLSMLTPPVAVASFVAAGLAGSGMWRTGFAALRFAAIAYVLPFFWVFNPALIANGSWTEIVFVVLTAIAAVYLIARATVFRAESRLIQIAVIFALILLALVIGSSTIWLASDSPLTFVAAAIGLVLAYFVGEPRSQAATPLPPAEQNAP